LDCLKVFVMPKFQFYATKWCDASRWLISFLTPVFHKVVQRHVWGVVRNLITVLL